MATVIVENVVAGQDDKDDVDVGALSYWRVLLRNYVPLHTNPKLHWHAKSQLVYCASTVIVECASRQPTMKAKMTRKYGAF